MAINPSVVTQNVDTISRPTGNIYRSAYIISKRARQIATNLKEELNGKLAEFSTDIDNLDEVFENREQIEISKHYERMAKPHLMSLHEFLNNKLNYRNRDAESKEPAE